MKRYKLLVWIAAIMLFMTAEVNAQSTCCSAIAEKIITSSTQYGVGYSNVLNTYLSPQNYKGWNVGVVRETLHHHPFHASRWKSQTFFSGLLSYTHNLVDNNVEVTGMGDWKYGLYYPILHYQKSLLWYVGGAADIHGGFTYNMRNGNNPAAAYLSGNVDVSTLLQWNFKIKHIPFMLNYQLNIPMMGVAFSPQYGQSYYEIFSLNNSKGVVKFTSPFNAPSSLLKLSLDFPVSSARLRISYLWDVNQLEVNHLKTHIYNHLFMVGFVKEFNVIPFKKNRK